MTRLTLAAFAVALALAPAAATAAPFDACSPDGAAPLPLNQVVTVPAMAGSAPPCDNARYASVAFRVGDRVTLRAAAAAGELDVGFVPPGAPPPTNGGLYDDGWADCRLEVQANQGDEISCSIVANATVALQAHGPGVVGVWVTHRGPVQHSAPGQCDFLASAPLVRLGSTQYANDDQGCPNQDRQFPRYQRWRVRIRHPALLRLTVALTTPEDRLGSLAGPWEDVFVVKPRVDSSDYRKPGRYVCANRRRSGQQRASFVCPVRRAGVYTVYAYVTQLTLSWSLR